MSIFLSNKTMWDMPLDSVAASGEKRITHWFGNLVFVVIGAICKLLFRYKVTNREALRAFQGKSGAVVICNHTSYLDVIFLYLAARPKQWIRLIGKDSLFTQAGGLLGQALSRVGAFPIKRDSADRTAIKRAVACLKRKELVGIMPEGTRRGKSDRIPSLHAGAALIARMGKVPILPCTVRNAEKVKQKGKFLRFPKITIEFGGAILLEDFDFLPKAERLEGCSWYAMREVFALSQNVDAREVDMVALFPETKDYSLLFEEREIPTHTVREAIASFERSSNASS